VIGWRFGNRRRSTVVDDDPVKQIRKQTAIVVRYTLVWSVVGGAVSYACLALLGVGIPAPEVDILWRLIGGLAVGALAGVGATVFVQLLVIVARAVRKPRAA